MVKAAWDLITPSTINNCFKHVKVLPETPEDDPDDDVPLSELRELMRQLPESEGNLAPEEYVRIDEEEETGHRLTDDDIICLVERSDVYDAAGGVDGDDDGDDDDEIDEVSAKKDISLTAAKDHIKGRISHFEQVVPNQTLKDMNYNMEALDFLWKMDGVITERTCRESKHNSRTF